MPGPRRGRRGNGSHCPTAPPPLQTGEMMLALATPTLVILVVLGVLLLLGVAFFNRLIRLRNKVDEAFAGIDVQLKRRHDLVPNLVEVVKAYARHEQETLEEVVQARTAARTTDEGGTVEERAQSENGLSRSLGKLIALVERYPELKADGNFRKLQHDLVEIENDLQYARRYYNATVRDLNTQAEQFPASLIAGLAGIEGRAFFEIDDPTTRLAPRVDLDA